MVSRKGAEIKKEDRLHGRDESSEVLEGMSQELAIAEWCSKHPSSGDECHGMHAR